MVSTLRSERLAGGYGDLRQLPGVLLQHLSRRVDVDGVPATGVLAEAAAGALLLVQHGHTEEVADLAVGVTEVEGIERADLDAELAAAADAVVLDDDGLGPLLARERAADLADLVQDRLRRADDAAGAAIDAERRVDYVDLITRAGDRVRRAALGAGSAADARFDDGVGHGSSVGNIDSPDLV